MRPAMSKKSSRYPGAAVHTSVQQARLKESLQHDVFLKNLTPKKELQLERRRLEERREKKRQEQRRREHERDGRFHVMSNLLCGHRLQERKIGIHLGDMIE